MKKSKQRQITTKSDIKKAKFVELWRDTHGHISNICRALSMDRNTYYRWLEKDKEFAMALVNAEGELNDEIRNVLIQKAADGDMTAVIFYLKNKHPDFKQNKEGSITQNNFFTIIQNDRKQFQL